MLKEISIEITRKCSNQCIHCSSFSNPNCNELIPMDKFKEVIDGAQKLGLTTVCFSGGEPFLHPDLCEMVNYVFSKGLKSYIYSSGIYINSLGQNESIPLQILNKLADKVTKIILNIEAIDHDVYNSIMGTINCFKYLEETIINAINCKILLEAHFVPMKKNIDQIDKVIDFCAKRGIAKVSFLRLVMHGRANIYKQHTQITEDELKLIIDKLQRIKENNNYPIRIGIPLQTSVKECRCEAAKGKLNIRFDGNVYPCEVFKNDKIFQLMHKKPSNIYKNSIEDIYLNSEYLQEARVLIERFLNTSNCENCVGQYYINYCEGKK